MAISKKQFKTWQSNFLAWLEDIKPCVLHADGSFKPIQLEDFQLEDLQKALTLDEDGNFLYSTIIYSYPRRHSKSTLCALLVLWRFCTRQGENIVCLSNSKTQSNSVSFGLLKKIILNTPFLREFIGLENILQELIRLEEFNNIIQSVSCNVSALYGQKVTCGWTSEVHASYSDEAMQVLGSSLGDSLNSWLLIDSTIDETGGTLHKLQILAETGEDKTICFNLRQYADLKEALEKSPQWISRKWLQSRHKQLLPAIFASQHLNQRTESDSSLFSKGDIEVISRDKLPHPFTREQLEAYTQGRKHIVGGALDRAYAFSIHGDSTIFTSIAKIGNETGEAEYLILNQQKIFGSLAIGIKQAILRDNKEYTLANTVIEAYNSQDIATWATEQGLPCEIIHATTTAQQSPFLELHRIVKERRIKFSSKLKDLKREMSTFQYEVVKGVPRFGNDKFHDDRVYSLAWAIHSLRSQELAVYEVKNLLCNSQSKHKSLCYLRGGDMILSCSQQCQSHVQVNIMFNQYRSTKPESEMSLPNFFHRLVKHNGIKIYQ